MRTLIPYLLERNDTILGGCHDVQRRILRHNSGKIAKRQCFVIDYQDARKTTESLASRRDGLNVRQALHRAMAGGLAAESGRRWFFAQQYHLPGGLVL